MQTFAVSERVIAELTSLFWRKPQEFWNVRRQDLGPKSAHKLSWVD
jgi:hypothetical protein